MLDKVELRVPGKTLFRPEFRWIETEVAYAGEGSMIRRSQWYQGVVDLRACGLDALLHAFYKRVKRGPHKLELLRTGRKTLAEMALIAATLFEIDPHTLENMRLDFAADLHDIPLDYLHASLRVRFKRTTDERGELEYERIGKKRIEYFRYGKAPNCVRSYDKVAESKARVPEVTATMKAQGLNFSFEQAFGFGPDAVVSRVERQAGGGRIPRELATFGDLRRADDFNPFSNIELIPNAVPTPDPIRYGTAEMLKLVGTGELIRRYGLQDARALLNTNGNAKRYLDEFRDYVSYCKTQFNLSPESLVDTYRASVREQIWGPPKAA